MFASNALNPAKVSRVVESDGEERTLEVVVDELQLSLAIGKKGQNVRLASKLVGWRIDIKSEEDKRDEAERELARMARRETAVGDLAEVSLEVAEKLGASGVSTVGQLLDLSEQKLLSLPSIDPESAVALRAAASEFVATVSSGSDSELDSTATDARDTGDAGDGDIGNAESAVDE